MIGNNKIYDWEQQKVLHIYSLCQRLEEVKYQEVRYPDAEVRYPELRHQEARNQQLSDWSLDTTS